MQTGRSKVRREDKAGQLSVPALGVPAALGLCMPWRGAWLQHKLARTCGQSSQARLAQSAERKALNLVVVGSSPTVGVSSALDYCMASAACSSATEPRLGRLFHREDNATQLSVPTLALPASLDLCMPWRGAWRHHHLLRTSGESSQARLAQSAERKALNLVVVGSSPTVGVLSVDWWSKAVISVITYYYSN